MEESRSPRYEPEQYETDPELDADVAPSPAEDEHEAVLVEEVKPTVKTGNKRPAVERSISVSTLREQVKRRRMHTERTDEPSRKSVQKTITAVPHIRYMDERQKLLEWGSQLHLHTRELAEYVLNARWFPGQPKRGGKSYDGNNEIGDTVYDSNYSIPELYKAMAVMLGKNVDQKEAAPYSSTNIHISIMDTAINRT